MTGALIAFATNGYAFREPERAAVRPLVAAVVDAAMRDARTARVEIALAALGSPRARLCASLIGRSETLGPIEAALVNGIAAAAGATPATAVVCAAFAAGESARVSGAAVLDAIVAGVEVALRIERALRGHAERGWDARGTCGRLGAAVAAARAFGLPRAAARNAFGLAATAAGGLRAAGGTMTEAYIIGSAAADGVEAALLGRAEFTAAPAALEGRRGLAALMASGIDGEALLAGLGERFAVVELGAATPPRVPAALLSAIAELGSAPSIAPLLAAARADQPPDAVGAGAGAGDGGPLHAPGGTGSGGVTVSPNSIGYDDAPSVM